MRTGYWILDTEYCESRRASIKDSVNQCSAGTRQQGFTLIELLVVVAIMAIVMTISVPFMNNAINSPKGINGAVRQVQETSKMARDWAILKQTPHQLRIRPGEGIFEVQAGGGGGSRMPGRLESRNLAGDEWRMPDRPATPVAGLQGWPNPGRGAVTFRRGEGSAEALEHVWTGSRPPLCKNASTRCCNGASTL